MIVFFVGTPGSGKTYEAVKKIVDNLRMGRTVCTNIDGMDDPRNHEYIKSLVNLDDFTFAQRFIYLGRDDVTCFWKTRKVEKTVFLPDGSTDLVVEDRLICPKGSLIVIDEVHKHFNARAWQSKENLEMADWASTHRHDGYDLVLITQDIEKVEKQVRSLTEWCYFFRKVNFLGGGVQKKYLCYSYSGDDHRGQPLSKSVRHYHSKYFPCYKSYTTSDAKEVGFMTHVNIFKHPIFFAIPVVIVFCLWMASKSSLASGDIFGTQKRLKDTDKKIASQRSVSSSPVSSVPVPVVQKPVSSSSQLPQVISASAPSNSPLPSPPAPPSWHSYPVSGYLKVGARTIFLVHGKTLYAGQCRNHNTSLQTVDCFGQYIPAPEPAPVSAPPVSVSSSSPSTAHSKDAYSPPPESIVWWRSTPNSSEKEPVVIR